jgi:tetratricopeptide (TPR) repeat protein
MTTTAHAIGRWRRTATSLVLACAAFVAGAGNVAARPFVPDRDDVVLERVPARGDPQERLLRTAIAAARATPDAPDVAVRLADLHLARWRRTGDPREIGGAQAAIAPWWTAPDPPDDVRLVRATLRQATHAFDAANADLDALLARDPRNAQAWLLRATVLGVRGDHAGALRACQPLLGLVGALPFATCAATPLSMTGHATRATALVTSALGDGRNAAPSERAWALTVLGEIAARRGDLATAETHLRDALRAAPDLYATTALADVLIDAGRHAAVRELLGDAPPADAARLRLAIAERALGRSTATSHVASLRASFERSRARGDTAHRREEARFALALAGDVRAALALARENWQEQRESADARLLLEAALAANAPAAAQPVLAWMRETRVEDVALTALATRLGETGR